MFCFFTISMICRAQCITAQQDHYQEHCLNLPWLGTTQGTNSTDDIFKSFRHFATVGLFIHHFWQTVSHRMDLGNIIPDGFILINNTSL